MSGTNEGFGAPTRTKQFPLVSEVFSVAGTYVFKVPAGVHELFVEVLGGGGGAGGDGNNGGGCAGSPGANGAPGSDGGYGAGTIKVVPGQEFTVTVGAGGPGGGTGANGSTGGTSSFAAVISATGGGGGVKGGDGAGSSYVPSPVYGPGSCCGGGTPANSEWNPSNGTSAARINKTGGGARGGARVGGAGNAGRVIVWYKKAA